METIDNPAKGVNASLRTFTEEQTIDFRDTLIDIENILDKSSEILNNSLFEIISDSVIKEVGKFNATPMTCKWICELWDKIESILNNTIWITCEKKLHYLKSAKDLTSSQVFYSFEDLRNKNPQEIENILNWLYSNVHYIISLLNTSIKYMKWTQIKFYWKELKNIWKIINFIEAYLNVAFWV